MKHTSTFFKEPQLMVDDHHGQYMGQIAFETLADTYKKQAIRKLSEETVESLKAGPDDEWHHEACDSLTNVVFKTPSGQKWSLNYAEGGIWAIPYCYLRTKAANEFFGN